MHTSSKGFPRLKRNNCDTDKQMVNPLWKNLDRHFGTSFLCSATFRCLACVRGVCVSLAVENHWAVEPNPCLSCGACCGFFRVSFYWAELSSAHGQVPDELTEQISPHRACMKGTACEPVRCNALLGDIAQTVRCTIYDQRPTPCRDFHTHNPDGSVAEACTRARAKWGLAPLSPFTEESEIA